jgi:hypothetical protein
MIFCILNRFLASPTSSRLMLRALCWKYGKGGLGALSSCQAVLVEASLVETNTCCPLIQDVFTWMTNQDFILFDICEANRGKDGVLWQVDLIFLAAKMASMINPESDRDFQCLIHA